jgi:hypothetical protein
LKAEILAKLDVFERDLRALRISVKNLQTERVGRQDLREKAEQVANRWVEEIRSPLEHKFKLPSDAIQTMSGLMKRLHVLSRPNNRKTSYLETLDAALAGFKNTWLLPIQQMATEVESIFDLTKVVAGLSSAEESDYLNEAIQCANSGYHRAAIVMGWCAAVDRMQRKIQTVGFAKFNSASQTVKSQTSGKFKNWNKSFNITTLGELQAIFDADLIVVLEGLGLLDGNQAARLNRALQDRNQSAHPGSAPIEEPHLLAFFTDVARIVLTNPAFEI